MKTNSLFLFTTALLFFVISCTSPPPPPDLEQIKTELQALEDAYAEAQNNKDAEGVVTYYAEDAVSLPDGKPVLSGKAAILADIKEEMAKDMSNATIKFEVVKVWAQGDLVVEQGKSVSTKPSGEQTMGKYISVFEKRDGKYVCVRDIWNNDTKEDDDDDDDGDDDDDDDDEGSD